MIRMAVIIIINAMTSGLFMKRNLDWHRKLLLISIPLFALFTQIQTEYMIKRIELKVNNE